MRRLMAVIVVVVMGCDSRCGCRSGVARRASCDRRAATAAAFTDGCRVVGLVRGRPVDAALAPDLGRLNLVRLDARLLAGWRRRRRRRR